MEPKETIDALKNIQQSQKLLEMSDAIDGAVALIEEYQRINVLKGAKYGV